jgi:glycosyltransferase involved in cell wall biosynthesis
LKECDALIVNTDGTETLYKQRYPEWQHKIFCIPNGYDVLQPPEKISPRVGFRIMHVGNFYGSRGPELLLDALREIGDPSIEFVQLGLGTPSLENETAVNVSILTSVPRAKALEMMTSASLLYLKQGFENDVTHYVSVAAKTYEYLATGLPILADCPEGDNAQIVRQYCSAPYVVTSGQKADLKAAIVAARLAHADMSPRVTPEFTERFSRTRLTHQLAAILDSVVPASQSEERRC